MDTFSNFLKEQRKKENKEQIKEVIQNYIKKNPNRQRKDLYDYLNEHYDLNLTTYDYDGRNDYARVALQTEKWEYDYIVDKVFEELKKK